LNDYETSDALIHMLIQKVAHGGNLLLDIGPAADGTIPVIMQQRLADMGAWLKTNGGAIFGTTATKLASNKDVYYTQKGNNLYVIFTTAMDKPLTIELARAPGKATLLGSNKKVSFKFGNGKCIINPLNVYPNLPSGGYAWVIKLEGVQ
jgi:alpha-L-fucosidase